MTPQALDAATEARVIPAQRSPGGSLPWLDGLIEGGIALVLLGAPLPFGGVLPWAQALIETAVGFLCALVLVRALRAGELSVRLTPLLWPGLAMLLLVSAQLLSPSGSASPYATWESARLYVAYFAFLLVLGVHLRTRERVVRLVVVTVMGGVALAILGLVTQAQGRALILWFPKEHYLDRLTATFVNPNHQALYFSLVLFLALGLLLRQGGRGRAAPGAARGLVPAAWTIGLAGQVLLGTAVVVLATALLLTASRGGLFSTLAGLAVLLALTLHGRTNRWVPVALLVAMAVFGVYASWFGLDLLMERLHVVATEPFRDVRWAVWDGTLAALREAPVRGVGLGAFEDVFRPYQPQSIGHWKLVDYAHNDYLQLLVEGGLAALLVLVWALAALVLFVFPRWSARRDPAVRGLTMGGLGALTAAAVHSVTDFGLHMPANALLVVLVGALLPAVVTLRVHRTGYRVDLEEWRIPLSGPWRRSAVVAALVVTAVAAAIPVPPAVADWQLRSAATAPARRGLADGTASQSELVRARENLILSARLDPWNPTVQLALGTVSDELAARVWRHGVALDGRRLRQPASPAERLGASRDLLATALGAYEQSLRARPRAAATHEHFAWFLGRLDEVRRALAGTHAGDGAAPELAAALSGESLLPRALDHLREAIRRDPGNPYRHRGLGLIALAHSRELPGATVLAAEGFRQALLLDRWMLADIADRLLAPPVADPGLLLASVPPRVPLLIDLGRHLDRRGRPAPAAVAFETALGVASGAVEQADARLAYGQALLRRKEIGRALAEFRQALVLTPKSPDVFAALGEVYEAAEQWTEAESALGSAVTLAAESAPQQVNSYRAGLARYLTRRGQLDRALALRRQILAAAPQDPWAHYAAAYLHELRGEATEAYREYRLIEELGRSDWAINAEIARAYTRQGHFREAVAAYEVAVRLAPQPADLRIELAALFTRIGQRDEAIEQYRSVLARQPYHEAARRALGSFGMVAAEAASRP